MPGVVFAPQRKGILSLALEELVGGAIGGMFERDAAARNHKLNQQALDADVIRQQGVRDNNADFIDQRASFARGNEDGNIKSALYAAFADAEAGKNLMQNFQQFMPNAAMQNVNLGDKVRTDVYDPVTGAPISQQYDATGLNPDTKYASDQALQGSYASAGASRYGHQLDYNAALQRLEQEAGYNDRIMAAQAAEAQAGRQHDINMAREFGVGVPNQRQSNPLQALLDLAELSSNVDPLGDSQLASKLQVAAESLLGGGGAPSAPVAADPAVAEDTMTWAKRKGLPTGQPPAPTYTGKPIGLNSEAFSGMDSMAQQAIRDQVKNNNVTMDLQPELVNAIRAGVI
jgi:hypothetical protein